MICSMVSVFTKKNDDICTFLSPGQPREVWVPDQAGREGEELEEALVRAQARRAAVLQVTCKYGITVTCTCIT